MAEPKKFSFGFSKVVKKPTLFVPKPVETVEYIKCVEDKTVKLVHEEAVKPKELPVIPMPAGSSVRDRILDAIKAREAKAGKNKFGSNIGEFEDRNGVTHEATSTQNSGEAVEQNGDTTKNEQKDDAKPLTLDEMAAKELLENARMDVVEKKEDVVIVAEDGANRKQSTIEDYENMPINDFGLAMLRGMGWDPKKGIGLNEKIVTPAAPQLRPKGMGLGADKSLVSQTQPGKSSTEELVMKKDSMVKVIHGPHSQLYGKVEGFEELPGRILVRLTLSNSVVSLGEFMVQLVGPTEYNKNAKVMNLDKYNAALDQDVKPQIKTENRPRELNSTKRSDEWRSRSPVSSDWHKSKKKEERSRDRWSPKRSSKRDNSGSDSSEDNYRKRQSPERRRHKSSKKSKYRSSDSSDESDHRKSKKSSKSSKKSKHRSRRSDSDSSPERHRKKHKKSRK